MNLTARQRPARTAPSWGQAESADLESGLRAIGLDPTAQQLAQLLAYARLLLKWNRTYNLLGATTAEEIIASHFLDSLATLPVIRRWLLQPVKRSAAEPLLLDIGTGAGLPGLLLAIMLPELPIGLVEPIGKKTAFLRQAISQLGLAPVRLWEARIENLESRDFYPSQGLHTSQGLDMSQRLHAGHGYRPGQDVQPTPHFICRAFASLAHFAAVCAPYAIEGSLLFAMKTSRVGEEVAELTGSVEVMAVEPLQTIGNKHRNLVVMRLNRTRTMQHASQGSRPGLPIPSTTRPA